MRMTSGRKFWKVRMVLQVDEREGHTNDGQQGESDLEIGICHHGITVLFEVEPLGIMECGISVHHITLFRTAAGASSRPADDPPAVPLKMWFVSEGIFRRT
jgi:hypothetical protein